MHAESYGHARDAYRSLLVVLPHSELSLRRSSPSGVNLQMHYRPAEAVLVLTLLVWLAGCSGIHGTRLGDAAAGGANANRTEAGREPTAVAMTHPPAPSSSDESARMTPAEARDYYVDSRVIQIRRPRSVHAGGEPPTAIDVTTDSGDTWERVGSFDTEQAVFAHAVDRDGEFGVRFVAPGNDAQNLPIQPDRIYHVDTTAPETAAAVEPEHDSYSPGDLVNIVWATEDANLIDRPVQIRASDNGDEWTVLATDLPAEGELVYRIPQSSNGGSICLRVESLDRAGNVAQAIAGTMRVAAAGVDAATMTALNDTSPLLNDRVAADESIHTATLTGAEAHESITNPTEPTAAGTDSHGSRCENGLSHPRYSPVSSAVDETAGNESADGDCAKTAAGADIGGESSMSTAYDARGLMRDAAVDVPNTDELLARGATHHMQTEPLAGPVARTELTAAGVEADSPAADDSATPGIRGLPDGRPAPQAQHPLMVLERMDFGGGDARRIGTGEPGMASDRKMHVRWSMDEDSRTRDAQDQKPRASAGTGGWSWRTPSRMTRELITWVASIQQPDLPVVIIEDQADPSDEFIP